MEKIINIGNREIRMKSTAGTMREYRNNFKRDFIQDLQSLQTKLQEKSANELELIDLEMFENIAWCMAKTADKSVPDIIRWLDEFDTFDIMQALPEIMELLIANMEQIGSKKKTINE